MNSRIAIFGSTGQLGSELVRRLGEFAMPLTRNECDICDSASVRRVLLKLKPDTVVNAAAYTAVDMAEQEERECFSINAEAVKNIADTCDELSCPFVQVSTDYVFGQDTDRTAAYDEEDTPGPLNVYGRSKLAGEVNALRHGKTFVVRTSGLYGVRAGNRETTNFVETIVSRARTGSLLRVVADQHCTPTFSRDVVDAILALLGTNQYGIYHVANSGATTWHGFALEIVNQIGGSVDVLPVSSEEYVTLAGRPKFSMLSTAKLTDIVDLTLPDWSTALRDYLHCRGYAPAAPVLR